MESSLRIALLLNPFDLAVKGGEYAPQLARELLGRGHTVRGFGAPPGVIPRSGTDPGASGGSEARGVVAFAPDVILAYDALSPAAFLGARASRKLGVPLLLVEAGTRAAGLPHERFLRWLGERLWGPFVRRYAKRVIALDPVAEQQALAEGFQGDRIHVLPQGVDLNRYRPGLSSSLLAAHKARGRVLLYVGRVSEGRGLDLIIQAFANTVGQARDWSLVIAGSGPDAARRSLRAQVDRLGVGAGVHWFSLPREEELAGLLCSATLLLVPAVDDRVRGVQIPRALACGLPVLAADLPRLAHVFEDDGCGLLVKAGSAEAWTNGIRKAVSSPEARKRWGQRARAIAEERLDWAVIARSVEGLMEEATHTEEPSEEPGRARAS